MNDSVFNVLSFDELSTLAREHPELFERYRRHLIEQAIQSSPDRLQERLRKLQWRVERIRDRAANPLSACITISSLMWDSLAGDEGLLPTIQGSGKAPARMKAPVIRLLASPEKKKS